jgi:pimeloyl-ACP methyl ester carboxylesterase
MAGSWFLDGYTWWDISWDGRSRGFSVQDWLAVIPGPFTLSSESPICDTSPPGPSPAVRLNWTNSNNALFYDVYRNGALYASSVTGITYYNSANLIAGQTYSYFVRARNGSGNQDSENTISVYFPTNICDNATVPISPANLTATSYTSYISLVWSDNSTNENGFKIERKTGAGGSWNLIATVGSNSTQHNDTAAATGITYYYRVYAYNNAGNSGYSNESGATITIPVSPPTANTLAYQVNGPDSVLLFGTVNPNGGQTSVWFQWGTNTTYGNVTAFQDIGTGSVVVQVAHQVSGLLANTTYHFRIVGQNSAGTTYGSDLTFTAPPSAVNPPVVATNPPTSVAISSATLQGSINSNGAPSTAWFEWGMNTNYGNSTTPLSAGSSTSVVPFSQTVTGLSSNTTYHYRTVGQNSAGVRYGGDQTFTTLTDPTLPPLIGFNYLVINPIESPQSLDSPVHVTVRAIDRSGQPMTTFAGPVTLIANGPGMIINDRIQSGGVTVFTVIFGQAYASNQLHVQSGSLYGDSNVFDVGSVVSSEVYSVQGRVEDSSRNDIAATVHLQDTAHDFQAITVNGDFEFTADQHIPAGRYTLWTELFGIRYDFEVNLGAGINKVAALVTRGAKPAVILVPGFMGSNARENGGTVYPELPINKHTPRNDLILHDPFKKPGWRKLRENLEAAGFEVFDCPWDWRLAPDDRDAQLALKNTIAEAKLKTGSVKVDIIAHSMGGLLARAYIQGSDYAGDIDRFAMVGTPNHGSLLAYPGWEGGDTVLADFMAGNSGGYQCNFNPLSNIADYFYSQTLDKLYAKMKGGHAIQFYEYHICGLRPEPQPKKDLNQIRDFIHEDVAGLGSLLSTNYYCLKSVSKSCGQVSPPYKNTFLTALNDDSDRDRLTNGTVNTKLFASNAEETMQIVNVILGGGLFQDGTPQRPFAPTENAGDGTVLYASAQLGVPTHPSTSKGEHAFLINKFRTEISEFLTSGRTLMPASPRYFPLAATQPASQLALSVDNGYAALLTGPDNARNGIDLEVPIEFEESVGANLLRDGNVASVILTDPATGVYEVKLTGNLAGTARAVVAWMDENQSEELVVNVYHNPSATSFRFMVDPTAGPVLSLVADIGQPENPAAEKSGDTTALQWSAPTVGVAASYKVYRRQDFQNDFMLLDSVTVPTTSLVTTDPYNDPRVIYAVSAVDSLGNESVLSEIIDNQPVVYTNHEYRRFPWAMFLPALNNKK